MREKDRVNEEEREGGGEEVRVRVMSEDEIVREKEKGETEEER